ncbi:MAG: hypothetical protein KKB31_02680 [Nanoarchaeota archaeon]|nr:hypothetical protein [Nanoarchaeota archaeon]
MSKYFVKKKYKGKFYYLVIEAVPEKKAKQLKKDGEPIFDSRSEATEYISSKR